MHPLNRRQREIAAAVRDEVRRRYPLGIIPPMEGGRLFRELADRLLCRSDQISELRAGWELAAQPGGCGAGGEGADKPGALSRPKATGDATIGFDPCPHTHTECPWPRRRRLRVGKSGGISSV